MKKIFNILIVLLISFILTGCNTSISKNSEESKTDNTLTCKFYKSLSDSTSSYISSYKDFSDELIFNFDSNDELISINENQAYDYSHLNMQRVSDTNKLKEKIEEVKYVKVDININKSNKDMFFNYLIDVKAIKDDLYNGLINTNFYEEIDKSYSLMFTIYSLDSEFIEKYINLNKESLKIKLVTDSDGIINCK